MDHHDEEPMLTKLQAYDAMFRFLEEEYRVCPSNEIGGLLGSLSRNIWADQRSVDPGAWEQWGEAVGLTLSENTPPFKNDKRDLQSSTHVICQNGNKTFWQITPLLPLF